MADARAGIGIRDDARAWTDHRRRRHRLHTDYYNWLIGAAQRPDAIGMAVRHAVELAELPILVTVRAHPKPSLSCLGKRATAESK